MTTIDLTETETSLQPNGKLSMKLLEPNRTFHLSNSIELLGSIEFDNRTQSNSDKKMEQSNPLELWLNAIRMAKLAYIRLKMIKNDYSSGS